MTETKIVETPVGKHKVELKKWLTGRDRRAIRSVYTDSFQIGIKGEEGETPETEIKNISGSIVDKAEDKAIEIIVVSIDGEKENILERLLEMRDDDYDFVIKAINDITGKKK